MVEEPKISDPTYQDKDIRVGVIFWSIIFCLFFCLFSLWAMKKLFFKYDAGYQAQKESVSILAQERVLPTANDSLLQVNEEADLKKYRATENAILNEYSWAQEDGKKVRIPVERAIELIAEKGELPTSATAKPAAQAPEKKIVPVAEAVADPAGGEK